MPASNEPSFGRRRTALAAALAGALAMALVAAWVLVTRSGEDDAKRPVSPPSVTAPANLAALVVQRVAFCDRLEDTDVGDALDAPVSGSDQYRSGERVRLAPGADDVSHEFGCTYRAASGARARVWVFAEPVVAREAARIGRGVRREPGCRPLDARPAFGRSAASTVCRAPTPRERQVTLRGLFGDAWLSCQVTTARAEPQTEVVRRSSRWCVRVATALGSS